MKGVTHLIIDLDGKYTPAFKDIVPHANVKVVLTPPRAPRCNVFAERFVKTLQTSVLDCMIFFGESSLRRAVGEFIRHHDPQERNHQGIGNKIPAPGPEVGRKHGVMRRRDRLGGMLRYYYREAV